MEFGSFQVGDSKSEYKLQLSNLTYSDFDGNIVTSLLSQNGKRFSTYDRDNDNENLLVVSTLLK